MKNMVDIPDYMARMVGKGKMSNVTIPCDYPLLFIDMVNLQNDESVVAYRYSLMTHIPKYMRHMVGDVKAVEFSDTVETQLGVRRVRTPATWVLRMTICDVDKMVVRRGKQFIRNQISTFTKKFFTIRESYRDVEEVIDF